MIPPFETTFAVPLSCEACVKDVSTSLYKLPGITSISASLPTQQLSILGTAAPSAIARAIASTGRDAILRGSGQADSAGVCILETHAAGVADPVRGLVRMVQVAPALTVLDVTLKGVRPGEYAVSLRESGDVSEGARRLGRVWDDAEEAAAAEREGGARVARGVLGTVVVGEEGLGSAFVDRPFKMWEVIGRGMVACRKGVELGGLDKEDPDTLVGVVARSAGVWDNDKTVCSCSGKTVWEERREQVGRGML